MKNPSHKRLNESKKAFIQAMNEYKHTDKDIIQICEKQLELRLKIARLQDKKDKAVNNCHYLLALKYRDKEKELEAEQMPLINLLNILRRKLNKKPIK